MAGRQLNAEGLLGVYYVMDYGRAIGDGVTPDDAALKAADRAAVNAGGATVVVANPHRVSAGLSMTSPVLFLGNGQVLPDTGVTLTLNGPIDAGPYQIFGGAGTVALTSNAADVFPAAWWGMAPAATAATNTAALAAAVTASLSAGQGIAAVRLPGGACHISAQQAITNASNVFLVGAIPTGQTEPTVLVWDGAAGGTPLSLVGVRDSIVSRFALKAGTNTFAVGIEYDQTAGSTVTSTNNTFSFLSIDGPTTVGIRVGNSAIGNCDLNLFDAVYINGTASTTAYGYYWNNGQSKVNVIHRGGISNCGTGIYVNAGSLRCNGVTFETSSTQDVYLANVNDPFSFVSCNSENSPRFLVTASSATAGDVAIRDCRLDCGTKLAGDGRYISYGFAGTLTLDGVDFANGVQHATWRLYTTGVNGSGGETGSVVVARGVAFPNATPIDTASAGIFSFEGTACQLDGTARVLPRQYLAYGVGTQLTAAAGANAGTSPPAPLVASNSTDRSGSLTCGTGTSPAAGALVVVTFVWAWQAVPRVRVMPTNAAAAALGQPYLTVTATGFTINVPNAPSASQGNTVYGFDWWCES